MPEKCGENWGWNHVSVVGGFDRGSGTKRWKCNHCNRLYNGSYSRVRAHLLGFNGLGVKPCPVIDSSSKEALRILDEDRLARKLMKRKLPSIAKPASRKLFRGINRQVFLDCFSRSMSNINNNVAREEVHDTVARFFYVDGLSFDVVSSSYFREMVEALGAIGPKYVLPTIDQLSGCLLSREKLRLEKALALVRRSWPYAGCTILCVNRLDGSLGCICVNFFVASPRGLMFLKEVDIIEGDGPDNQFINELTNAITEVGPSNVFQVLTHLGGQASDAFESVILSKFPQIFWSHCTSHSVLLLMEEISELDCMKPVVSCAREIDQCVSAFKHFDLLGKSSDPVAQKFAPSYAFVKRILESKAALQEVIIKEEWKQWRINNASEGSFNAEAAIARDDFWDSAQLMLEIHEPFVRLLSTFDVDKSVMGNVYNWRVLSLEALKRGMINGSLLTQLEELIERRWEKLFSPLHGAAYILHPRYFGKGQSTDQSLMKAWNATLERYESDIEGRRVLSEELKSYWREEGCFGETDTVECRDKMEAVTWWENFGFETLRLQSLAVKILSQIPSAAVLCQESWQCESILCKEAVQRLGLGAEKAKDFVFVRNNLRLQSLRNGKEMGTTNWHKGNSSSHEDKFC